MTEMTEARWAKALAHPLRAQILQRLGENVLSPGALATELGKPLGVVSYHVRMLRDYGMVELVRTEPKRGALEHFYRALSRPQRGRSERLLRTQLAALFGVPESAVKVREHVGDTHRGYTVKVVMPS